MKLSVTKNKLGVTLTRQLFAVHVEFTAAAFVLVSSTVAVIQTDSSEDTRQETSMGVNQHS